MTTEAVIFSVLVVLAVGWVLQAVISGHDKDVFKRIREQIVRDMDKGKK